MTLISIANANFALGSDLIDGDINRDEDVQPDGLGSVLGVIHACIWTGLITKPEIVERMRFAVPGLSKKCGKQLLDLLTGSDPQKHLLKKHLNGTYSMINAEGHMAQSSQASVQ